MVSPVCDGYQQPVVKSERAQRVSGATRSLDLTTPSLTPYLAVETRSVLLDIAGLGCIELVSVVALQNASQLANRRGKAAADG